MSKETVITLNDVSVRRGEKLLLKNISWNVHKGQNWAILGLNGAGKTTLLKIITCYMWPTLGSVDVLGYRYGKVNVHELRKSIGWVSNSLDQQLQSHQNDTALEIVLSGKYASVGLYDSITEDDNHQAMELLKKFDIQHITNEPLRVFSQGERKKVLLARAWMSELKLLILDEPCAGLDIYSREEFLNTLEKMTKEENAPTIVFVTHHIEEIIPSITDLLFIHSGEVVDSGTKEQVLTEKNLEQTFRVPLNLHWHNERPWISVKAKLL
ncbi:ABC transporter ATP-binding protein [Salipaludibacillus sp. CF4.18]|uniref:ABC transporter ATP-binding protein n=1 Tax=Salipaludibacillus sp. CF4.18 TaxID=3373081 RepID=UPI003EE57A92